MTLGATADGAAQFPVAESRSVRALSLCMDLAGGQRPPNQVRTGTRPTRPGIEPTAIGYETGLKSKASAFEELLPDFWRLTTFIEDEYVI
jgi:hypothetical protein